MGSLRDKVAIVTGAGRQNGMGFAAAKAMASAGADVVVTDLTLRRAELDYLGIYSANDNLASLEDRAKELEALGVRSLAIGADVTKPEEIRACVETTVDTFGSVDVLFNNAGTAVGVGPYLEIEDRQWDLSYQIHVKGTADFCKAVIPKMQARRRRLGRKQLVDVGGKGGSGSSGLHCNESGGDRPHQSPGVGVR